MEEVINKISKESSKLPRLQQTAQETLEFLGSQHGLMRSHPYELRERCLCVFQQSLDTNNSRITNHAIAGLQRIIWDKGFQTPFEHEDEEKWLSWQVLQATSGIALYGEDVQQEILKVYLQLSCSPPCQLTTRYLLHLLSLCLEVFPAGGALVQTAAITAATQTIQTFLATRSITHTEEEAETSKTEEGKSNEKDDSLETVAEEVMPVLGFLCRKLKENSTCPQPGPRSNQLLLQCLLTLLSNLEEDFAPNTLFLSFVWQQLCPLLVSLVGSPLNQKILPQTAGLEVGRGSSSQNPCPGVSSDLRPVYSLALELVRLVGHLGALRPVLESLFHRLLLYPPPSCRLEGLKLLKEIFRKPELLLHFAGPPLIEDAKANDLGLLKIAIDSIEQCCQLPESPLWYAGVACLDHLLASLLELSEQLPPAYAAVVNSTFTTLEDATYRDVCPVSRLADSCPNLPAAVESDDPRPLPKPTDDSNKHRAYFYETLRDLIREENSNKSPTWESPRKRSKSSPVPKTSEPEDKEVPQSNTLEDSQEEAAESYHTAAEEIKEEEESDKDTVPAPEDHSHASTVDDDKCSSLTTEGPESSEMDADDEEQEEHVEGGIQEALAQKLSTLWQAEQRERAQRLEEPQQSAHQERLNARQFVAALQELLPQLLAVRSSIEVDQALQEFASTYCQELWKSQENGPLLTILNADGIYLATYSALVLNLKLIHSGYYSTGLKASVPLSEQQFVEEVHGTGVLVYLSATWLAELYQVVLQKNLLAAAGYDFESPSNCSLTNLLTDLDGLNKNHPGSQQLSDYRRLERAAVPDTTSKESLAGKKLACRLLTCVWDILLEVLSALFRTNGESNIAAQLLGSSEVTKQEARREAISHSLEGLQRAAKLCNIVGLQSRCSVVFAHLAQASCCPLAPRRLKKFGRGRTSQSLHMAQILSMEVILSRGIELGSHNPACWKHVFLCCIYVLGLESAYFSQRQPLSGKSLLLTSRLASGPTVEGEAPTTTLPGIPVPFLKDVLVKFSPHKSGGVLKGAQLQEVLELLSQLVERLFEDAAGRLNLAALMGFLVELCAASHSQLFSGQPRPPRLSGLLLCHLGALMLRCVRSGRPLLHLMKSWSVVAPHFVEAACHKDPEISKKAVSTIHDIVRNLLSRHTELPHFHFNEALFKPFENLLCLELCEFDIQEQIIGSICEFVEGSSEEIHSGWRALFVALRAVQLPAEPEPRAEHLRAVLDVLEAFLAASNMLVFSYAAVDCLVCLLQHVRMGGDLEDDCSMETDHQDLSLSALKYLERCGRLLASAYRMPSCPVFHSGNRIQLPSEPTFVDPSLFLELITFSSEPPLTSASPYAPPMGEIIKDDTVTLAELDKPTHVLRVWFLLLEGLMGTVVSCPRRYQSPAIDTLFGFLRQLSEVPGPEFALYCINHLLLPSLQNWLRASHLPDSLSSFRQCCGLTAELVVDLLQGQLLPDSGGGGAPGTRVRGVKLVLHQLLLVLTECIAQPTEAVSRLGCSCLRHVLLSLSDSLPPDMWTVACQGLKRATTVSLYSLRQLMVCFHADSTNFYGDIGQVKVAARRDCGPGDTQRLLQVAQQVFLLDCQRGELGSEAPSLENRSYIFLLHPPGVDDPNHPDIIRVGFRSLVVGLVAHQILLQTLATLLLQQPHHVMPSLATLLPLSPKSCPASPLPGCLGKLGPEHLASILAILEDSFQAMCEFDARPGLKFLVQKVANCPVAANLYKQAGIGWSIHALVLFELVLHTEQASKPPQPSSADVAESCLMPENSYLQRLQQLFQQLCGSYTDIVMDKDGIQGVVDKIQDQPLFFLAAWQPIDDNILSVVEPGDNGSCSSPDSAEADKIYSVVTEKTVSEMVTQYKRRKTQHTLPCLVREKLQRSQSNSNSPDEDIALQCHHSILKDGEAHVQVWHQLLRSVLELHMSLPDPRFGQLMAAVYPGVRGLVQSCSEPQLRLCLVEWLDRVAAIFGFSS